MDANDYNPLDNQPDPGENSADAQQPETPAGKESPFANSPYVSLGTPEPEYTASGWSEPSTQPEAQRKKAGSGKGLKIAVSVVAAACLVGGSIAGTAAVVNHHWAQKTAALETEFERELNTLQSQLESQINAVSKGMVSGNPVAVSGGLAPSQIYSQNVRSVVAISNQSTTTNIYGQVSKTASTGSGFILTEDGYVVTNYHVVEGANKLTVLLYDGTEYEASLVGFESSNDIALLKVDATGLFPVTIGKSDDLIVGDLVVAIGNPLGELTSTMTVGYVSAKDRDVFTSQSHMINMLQTDAAINPGNSGGPLFNSRGEVVGITTAKYSGTTSSGASIEGIGFAIPIDDVIGMINDLKGYGYVTGAYLGITVKNVNAQDAEAYNLPLGAYVESVVSGSCAEAAGLQPKDIIVGLGDYSVDDTTDLLRALRKFQAGDTTTLQVYRSGTGSLLNLTVTLDEKPHDTPAPETQPTTEGSELPSGGSLEDWYRYFAPFFGNGND